MSLTPSDCVAPPAPSAQPRVVRALRIAASSSLLPGHPAWRGLPPDYQPAFGTFADWPAALRDEARADPLAVILFLEDVIDAAALDGAQDDPEKISAQLHLTLDAIDGALRRHSRHPLIIGWSLPSPGSAIVHSRRRSPWTLLGNAMADALYARAEVYPQLHLLPLDREFAQLGTRVAFDRRNFFMARCRLSSAGLRQLVGSLGSILDRIARPARKVLVLDCDNTLWGGVIAEDGLTGVRLGDEGAGAAFSAFQKEVRALQRAGVVIALASKNEEADVWRVFEAHPAMQLKRNDVTAARIDHRPKSENVARLAEDLGLGLDAIVFWDDNPLERAEMRFRCPEVLTPEPPAEVEAWPGALADLGVFDRFATTAEDRRKPELYAARARFQALRQGCGDEIDFLKQLQLRPREVALGPATLDRAVQLVTKTNQFNLRGIRHDAAELAALAEEPRGVTFLVHLRDQFADHGLVALVLCRETVDPEIAFLEGLMISCRVLGRHLEAWALARACALLRVKGYRHILAEYRPLARNGLIRDVLPSLGFRPLPAGNEAAAAAAQAGLSAGEVGLLFAADLGKLSLPYQDLFTHDGSQPA